MWHVVGLSVFPEELAVVSPVHSGHNGYYPVLRGSSDGSVMLSPDLAKPQRLYIENDTCAHHLSPNPINEYFSFLGFHASETPLMESKCIKVHLKFTYVKKEVLM